MDSRRRNQRPSGLHQQNRQVLATTAALSCSKCCLVTQWMLAGYFELNLRFQKAVNPPQTDDEAVAGGSHLEHTATETRNLVQKSVPLHAIACLIASHFLDSGENSVIALQSLWNAMRLTAFESIASHETVHNYGSEHACSWPLSTDSIS